MGKLSGIKVVDLTQFLPGPMMTLMMADQGADVLKIEPPAGDPARALGPFEGGQSVWFRNLNCRARLAGGRRRRTSDRACDPLQG
jgi:crotonobetainyl-CoA:carnitine CoA-transferase CaiB-like acyl-CoA transferase